MKQLRVLVAEDEPITSLDIREMLGEAGLVVVGDCGDGVRAISLARSLSPDLVIMDIKMPIMNGIEAAEVLNRERVAPVLLLTAYSNPELIEKARAAGVLAYLVKPVTKNSLIPACHIAVARYEEFDIIRNEIGDLQEALEARRLIERAKGLLQKKYLLSEENAFQKIRQVSQNQNKPLKEVAEAIVLSLQDKQ